MELQFYQYGSSSATDAAHQILSWRNAPEPLGFDLVHCRLLLMHLADPMAALQRLADAVAPGGLLLVEEWDYATTEAFQAEHPLSAVVNVTLCCRDSKSSISSRV